MQQFLKTLVRSCRASSKNSTNDTDMPLEPSSVLNKPTVTIGPTTVSEPYCVDKDPDPDLNLYKDSTPDVEPKMALRSSAVKQKL